MPKLSLKYNDTGFKISAFVNSYMKFNEMSFTKWTNKNETFYCAHNGYGFDYMLTSQHLFSNLHTWPWIFSTGNARQLDSLPIVQNFDFYSPNKIKFEINEKNNKV